MIKLREIQQKARKIGIRDQQIEKDYVISWMLEHHKMDIDFYINEFQAKCKSKGLKSNDFTNKLMERLPQYKGRWQSSLKEQIKDLPDFEKVVREVQRHIKKMKF